MKIIALPACAFAAAAFFFAADAAACAESPEGKIGMGKDTAAAPSISTGSAAASEEDVNKIAGQLRAILKKKAAAQEEERRRREQLENSADGNEVFPTGDDGMPPTPAWQEEVGKMGAAASRAAASLLETDLSDEDLSNLFAIIAALPPEPAAAESLLRLVKHKSPQIAALAASELSRTIALAQAKELALALVGASDQTAQALLNAWLALSRRHPQADKAEMAAILRGALDQGELSEIGETIAINQIAQLQGEEALPFLLAQIADAKFAKGRLAALNAALVFADKEEHQPDIEKAVLAALQDKERSTAVGAMRAASRLRLISAVPLIIAWIEKSANEQETAFGAESKNEGEAKVNGRHLPLPLRQGKLQPAIEALQKITGLRFGGDLAGWLHWWREHVEAVEKYLEILAEEPQDNLAVSALEGIAGAFHEREAAAEAALHFLTHEKPQVRAAACVAISSLKPHLAAEKLPELEGDKDEIVQRAVQKAMNIIAAAQMRKQPRSIENANGDRNSVSSPPVEE